MTVDMATVGGVLLVIGIIFSLDIAFGWGRNGGRALDVLVMSLVLVPILWAFGLYQALRGEQS